LAVLAVIKGSVASVGSSVPRLPEIRKRVMVLPSSLLHQNHQKPLGGHERPRDGLLHETLDRQKRYQIGLSTFLMEKKPVAPEHASNSLNIWGKFGQDQNVVAWQ
jgi:hypothetical protein